MVDKELEKLYVEQALNKKKIRERKRAVAKKEGKVVDSIDELICKHHEGGKFLEIGTIPDSYFYAHAKGKDALSIYQCEPCKGDTLVFPKSKAYDCPNCGIVIGEFVKRSYTSSWESWSALAGREGEHYYCSVCGDQVGSHYWKFS